MIDEAKSKEIAFNGISLIENVRALTIIDKNEIGFDSKVDVWEIDTEILIDKKNFPLVLHISFERQFPFDFPDIYLSPYSFERVKFIPHVDNDRLICTFDRETASTNPNDPAGIILKCLRRAKEIISDGLTGINHCDFDDEFKAYWEGKYDKEKHSPVNVLSLINKIQDENSLKLISLNNAIGNFDYVLHSSDELSIRLKEYLDEYNLEFKEVDIFYFNFFSINKPPFTLKNRDVLKFMQDAGIEILKKFKGFINKNEYPMFILCKKQLGENEYIFGWNHIPLKTDIKGFRSGKFKPFMAFSSTQSNDTVERITTDVFTMERLEKRTAGVVKLENEKCLLIAGLGSIGSNLIYFLNSINYPEFKLIDIERIRLENIARHFLGFEHIGNYKTNALKDYILKNNPLQKISTNESSIIDVIKNNADYVNESDYIFVSIGKANIDNWICQSLLEGKITKPIFLIWVEPYLCGGHCLYLHPSNPEFGKYFEDDLFKYNVIESREYKAGNKNLSLREAGCQTTYIPYSSTNVISFLSSLFPIISSIIDSSKTKSTSYTWVGNIKAITELEIKTSNYYKDTIEGTLIEHSL